MGGYAVAHTTSSEQSHESAGSDSVPAPHAEAPRGDLLNFAHARERLARGALVFRVAEVVAMLDARTTELREEAERIERERTTLGLPVYCDEVHGAQARADEMRLVADEVRTLRDGDVPMARDLRFELTARSAAHAKRHNYESFRSRACAEGAAVVERYLVPRCITWWGPQDTVTDSDLELLSRVMAGVPDVRATPVSGVDATPYLVRPVARSEWHAMLAADEVGRAPWEQPRGVVMFRPDEVAELLETEAGLYEQAADRLCLTRAREGEGTALRYLAKDLRGEIWRVRALAPGDVSGARQLLTFIQRERRDRERARRRALWRRAVDHLEVMAELVEDLLLPLSMDGPAYHEDRGGGSEREVYRRWEAGRPDVRDAVYGERSAATEG